MRRRRGRRVHNELVPAVAIAFGVGLLIALFCSVKLALIIAAVILIYLGVCFKPC